MRLRSMLFVPANGGRKVEKAFASAADAVILDLEDAVAIAEKPEARRLVVERLAAERPRFAWVRVNALTTAFCLEDLSAVVPAAPDAVVLPKAESATDIRIADWLIGQLETRHRLPAGRIGLAPIIETARGIAAAGEIAAASPRLQRLMFGAVDLALDMDLDLDDEAGPIGQARFAVSVASRAAGLAGPIDTAFPDFRDTERFRASSLRARAMGYAGKICIHPAQIDPANEVFTPTEQELDRARRVVAAFEAAEREGSASVQLDGAMIDYPVVLKARRVLGAG